MSSMQKLEKPKVVLSPEEKEDLDFIIEALKYYKAHLRKEKKKIN